MQLASLMYISSLSMSTQITFAFKVDNAVLPGDYKCIAEEFEFLLHKATEEKPIYIFLDAVDQLSPEDGASGMSWLPLDLPPNVKVVLSTSSEVQYRCYPVLQSILSKHKENFVEVRKPPLSLAFLASIEKDCSLFSFRK